jgi:hypothetical protein
LLKLVRFAFQPKQFCQVAVAGDRQTASQQRTRNKNSPDWMPSGTQLLTTAASEHRERFVDSPVNVLGSPLFCSLVVQITATYSISDLGF